MTEKPASLNTTGQTYRDFKVVKSIPIKELKCWLRELVHIPTGAHVMHIANDDPENLFCLSFQTIPATSNGIAHILEHTVLCGSKKYPVKDPFFAMLSRSLHTFMNALTGSDFTCYPAATQVPKDFFNLLEVYIDAVFHANLNELSFLQEGHRLEFAEPKNPESNLTHKGVVFNEMKGALASPTTRLAEALNEALFPDLTYGINSGGDPKIIPKLTYTELKQFYEEFYHPSRCLFFFYGNMPLEGHLDFISEHALKGVQKKEPLPSLPKQKRFSKPKKLTLEYPISQDEELENKTLISFGWLTTHILKQLDVLALSILEIILMDTDASPLKQAILKSGFCKQASIYMDVDISEVPIVITLRGCNPENADDLEEIIFNTIREIVHNGIPNKMIEDAMHQLEIFRSEIGGNHAPFGLSIFMRSGLLEQHGGNPEDGLIIHSLFDEIRKRNTEDPHYLTQLLKKYFLDNSHFVRVVMTPSKDLEAKELKDEVEDLEKIRSSLSTPQKEKIVRKCIELEDFQKQQEEENIDVLPKISMDDVPKSSRVYLLEKEKIVGLNVYHHSCFTNSIVYADLVFDLPYLRAEELPIIRLLTVLVGQLGTGDKSYSEVLEYIQANTGGISSYLTLNMQAFDHNIFHPSLYIRGKSLYRKADKLFPMMRNLCSSINWNEKERVKEILLKHYTTLNSTLNSNSLRYAISMSASGLDSASWIANTWYGIDYYHFIKHIVQNIDRELEPLIEKLKNLEQRSLGLKNPDLVITSDSDMYDVLKKNHFYGLQDLPGRVYEPWENIFHPAKVVSQGCLVSSPVAFTGHAFKTLSYQNPHAPALGIASSLFDNLILHPRIREKGGAYGSGAVSNSLSGNFYFYAHRDPNIVSTLMAFQESITAIVEGKFDANDLEEAKLEIVQSLDAPVAPGSRGDLAYGWLREGRTQAVRQAYRDRLLSATGDDVINAVKQHIVAQSQTGAVITFAGKEVLEKENAVFEALGKPPLPIHSV